MLIGYIFFFLIGTVIGSFLNVCIWRMPREESVVAPPSHCPRCGSRLGALDLLPLFSFLLLRRRCRKCKAPISWRYFTIEFITGVVFVVLFAVCFWQDRLWDLPFYLIFAAGLIAIFMIDLEHMIIPDELVIAGGVAATLRAVGIMFGLGNDPARGLLHLHLGSMSLPFPTFIAGAALGMAVFVGIELFSRLVFRKEGMGGGDMKLGAAIGALLGPASALLSFALAVGLGALVGIFLIILRGRKKVDYMPFGPFMVITAFALMVAPAAIWEGVREAWSWWMASVGG